jgi:hypothetical protein
MNRVTVIGVGNLQCGPAVVAALANYFGEREIEIVLWDADQERLELFDRLLRSLADLNRNPIFIMSTLDVDEALDGAWRVILCMDRNCAFKYLRAKGLGSDPTPPNHTPLSQACHLILDGRELEGRLLHFMPEPVRVPVEFYFQLDPPGEPSAEQRRELPHQILRWIRAEDYPYEFLQQHAQSGIKAWLDDVNAATAVSEL